MLAQNVVGTITRAEDIRIKYSYKVTRLPLRRDQSFASMIYACRERADEHEVPTCW